MGPFAPPPPQQDMFLTRPQRGEGGGGGKGPAGGGGQRAPCGFSQIAPEVLGISLWNLPYPPGQQFHTMCENIRSQVIIGQPWVTSEWRHVPPILINKKGWQETPPRPQFLSYDRLSYMIWRRISWATKLMSRIFQILKISKKIPKTTHFFFFKIKPLKINFFPKKNVKYARGRNGWWIYIQHFKWISSEMTEIWHKICPKQALFISFRDSTVIFRFLF